MDGGNRAKRKEKRGVGEGGIGSKGLRRTPEKAGGCKEIRAMTGRGVYPAGTSSALLKKNWRGGTRELTSNSEQRGQQKDFMSTKNQRRWF